MAESAGGYHHKLSSESSYTSTKIKQNFMADFSSPNDVIDLSLKRAICDICELISCVSLFLLWYLVSRKSLVIMLVAVTHLDCTKHLICRSKDTIILSLSCVCWSLSQLTGTLSKFAFSCMRFFSRCMSQIVEIKISVFDKTDYAYGSTKEESSIFIKYMTNLEKIEFEN